MTANVTPTVAAVSPKRARGGRAKPPGSASKTYSPEVLELMEAEVRDVIETQGTQEAAGEALGGIAQGTISAFLENWRGAGGKILIGLLQFRPQFALKLAELKTPGISREPLSVANEVARAFPNLEAAIQENRGRWLPLTVEKLHELARWWPTGDRSFGEWVDTGTLLDRDIRMVQSTARGPRGGHK